MSRAEDNRLPFFARRLAESPRLLIGLDFDGTLSPIVSHPHLAVLPPQVHEILYSLRCKPGVSVAVVSGRSLEDLRSRVGIDDLIYAGNHGLEILGPDLKFIHPQALAAMEATAKLAHLLSERLRDFSGAFVEDKSLSLSVHVRNVANADAVARISAIVESCVLEFAHSVCLRHGKKVLEIRPLVPWTKGHAVHWIRDNLDIPESATLYIGDDQTDEDVFLTLREGVSVKVGDALASEADHQLDDPDAVHQFLQALDLARADL